jgi:hypothetical protein
MKINFIEVFAMTTIALQFPSGRGTRHVSIFNIMGTWVSAIEDGRRAAQVYESLSRMSDENLAKRGLHRGDLPRVAVFGKI